VVLLGIAGTVAGGFFGYSHVSPLLGLSGASASSCNIKGNISSGGERIYHVPGQKYYGGTSISARRGERWFCSEAEAREAGWRRARR
jgi:hypothetical protein